MAISENLERIEITAIRRMFEISGKKPDVINLGIGEPDFDTPDFIKEAAYKAIKEGKTKYGPTVGIPELREALANRYNKLWGSGLSIDDVFITIGGENALFISMASLIKQGDEVLIISPAFPPYYAMATMLGASPKYLITRMESGFKPSVKELRKEITEKTRIIVVNSPSNPTGAVYDRALVEEIVSVASENNCYIIADEVYESFTYEGNFTSFAKMLKKYEKILIVNSFSKIYSMTGWRLGFLIAKDENVRKNAPKLQLYINTCPPTFTQYAALEALNSPEMEKRVQEFREAYRRRRDMVYKLLRESGVETNLPEGAFYIFPRIPIKMKSEEFCMKLLEEKNVMTVPGSGFGEGGEGHFRISYAASEEKIEEACKRIADFIQRLK